MNITWRERPKSRRGTTNPRSATLRFVLTGVENLAIAKAMAAGFSPAILMDLDGMPLWRTNIEVSESGFLLYDIDITYGPYSQKEPEPGDYKWSFATTGGTKHVTQALAHINSFVKQGDAAIDYKGAIGVNENGDVEGVDILDKAFKWTETWQLAIDSFSWGYAQVVAELTATVNDNLFRGFPKWTVLFEGAEGTRSAKDPTILDLTFHFAHQRSADNLTVGDIGNIGKAGWDYLWVSYKTVDGGAAMRTGKVPRQVDTELLYDESNFTLLGIGTGSL